MISRTTTGMPVPCAWYLSSARGRFSWTNRWIFFQNNIILC